MNCSCSQVDGHHARLAGPGGESDISGGGAANSGGAEGPQGEEGTAEDCPLLPLPQRAVQGTQVTKFSGHIQAWEMGCVVRYDANRVMSRLLMFTHPHYANQLLLILLHYHQKSKSYLYRIIFGRLWSQIARVCVCVCFKLH